ncbi:MAG: hypothetical protein ORN51_11835 [Akkermansiaceae bacterium]|nr:hypothetical protein [Akkermansiaceae bacterium]
MKPVIFTDPDEPRLAHLVDEHSAAIRFEKLTGKHLRHFDRAILIQDLKPGTFRFQSASCLAELSSNPNPVNLLHDLQANAEPASPEIMDSWPDSHHAPRPCVYATISTWQPEEFKKGYADSDGPETCHGIHKRAAEVMLGLAASWSNVKADAVTNSFTFGGPRFENTAPSLPWDKWAFLTAWFWSDWETRGRKKKLTLAMRSEEMKAAGYPHGIRAFENMHRRLFPKPTH